MKVIKKLFKLLIALIIVAILASFAVVAYGTSSRPVEYMEYVNKYAEEYNVDPLLVLSVIKVESNFRTDAESHMNAVGLMQLVPETAEWVTGKMKIDYDESMLKDPESNIKIGTYYLSYLINHFKDVDLAIVAYNGGMGNVQEWIDTEIVGKNGKGLENIPIDEARYYIVKVNNNYEAYKKLYGDTKLEDGIQKSPKTWLNNYFIQIKDLIVIFRKI
ncbi:MAG: lytic transglycosylase domain-containing protein [Miniphocaeibacter sp.]|uniref:lytic transglycosylase domain-containing protein n=1 Tax=Miniphocaeibacter sp. TaxID=3100973 RepID=UPI003BB100FC